MRTATLVLGACLVAAGCSGSTVDTNVATPTASTPSTTAAPTTPAPTAPEPTTTSPPTTAAPTTTVPLIARADEPLDVLVLGDSVTYEIAPGLVAALESTGQAVGHDHTLIGLGLSRWPDYAWWDDWAELVATVDPGVVILQVGSWDASPILEGLVRLPDPDAPTWRRDYTVLVETAVDVLTATGAPVYWVSMLPSQDPDQAGQLNGLLADIAADDDRMTFIDLTDAFVDPDGRYREVVRGLDGSVVPLRKIDGVHVCRDGAERAARLIAERIAADAGVAPPSGWETGPWRSDPLYDVNPCPAPTTS